MKISYERTYDSYSTRQGGVIFYEGTAELSPDVIVDRLNKLRILEQTLAFSNVMRPTCERCGKEVFRIRYCADCNITIMKRNDSKLLP